MRKFCNRCLNTSNSIILLSHKLHVLLIPLLKKSIIDCLKFILCTIRKKVMFKASALVIHDSCYTATILYSNIIARLRKSTRANVQIELLTSFTGVERSQNV